MRNTINKMRKVRKPTPWERLCRFLRTPEQRRTVKRTLRHLDACSRDTLCYALLEYMRWNEIWHFQDRWLDFQFKALVSYLKVERALDNL